MTLPVAYQDVPKVRANMVQGANGVFVDANGSSRGISNPLDRERLLELRKLADVVVTDGETARLEAYRIPLGADLAVITRTGFKPAAGSSTRKYLEIRMSPDEAIKYLLQLGYCRILLEVGPSVLSEIVAAGLVDELCLTNTDSSKPALSALGIASAELVHHEQLQDTSFGVWREIQAL